MSDYYKKLGIEPWVVLQSWMTTEQFEGYCLGQAIAYLARYNVRGIEGKGGVQDLKKAKDYIDLLISLQEGL